MKRQIIFLSIIIFTIAIFLPFNSMALPDGGCDPLDPLCPIDGGITLLIAAGIGIGARKAAKAKKFNKTD